MEQAIERAPLSPIPADCSLYAFHQQRKHHSASVKEKQGLSLCLTSSQPPAQAPHHRQAARRGEWKAAGWPLPGCCLLSFAPLARGEEEKRIIKPKRFGNFFLEQEDTRREVLVLGMMGGTVCGPLPSVPTTVCPVMVFSRSSLAS